MINAKVKFGQMDDAYVSIPGSLEPGMVEINAYSFLPESGIDISVGFVLSHETAGLLAKAILEHVARRRPKRKKA